LAAELPGLPPFGLNFHFTEARRQQTSAASDPLADDQAPSNAMRSKGKVADWLSRLDMTPRD
jgi:hypothetical protein